MKAFASQNIPGKAAAWGFFNQLDGRWLLAVGGPDAGSMVGKATTITVDGKLIHGTTPVKLTPGSRIVHFGELTEASVTAIADGWVLRISPANDFFGLGTISFSLRGSDDALTATRECVATLREIVAQENASRQKQQAAPPPPSASSSAAAKRYRIRDASPDAFLNLRAGPSTEFPIRAVIPQGATVEVTGTCGAIASRAAWCPVRWGSVTGWAHGGGLVEVSPMEAQPQSPPHRQASAEPQPRSSTAPQPNASNTPSPREDKRVVASAGTGFFVSTTGHILTNHHVVDDCKVIAVKTHDGARPLLVANAVARDKPNDLALIKLEEASSASGVVPLPWRRDVQLGESVNVFGFPHIGTLATTGSFTTGGVTSLAGIKDNLAHFQLSAPIQSGNSGGPVADAHGNIIGVVVSKLNALAIAESRGDLPQNVNFAIKASHAASFLDAHGVTLRPAHGSSGALSGPDLAERLRKASVLIVCLSSIRRS
jgi:S1-C subfamily serine protease